MSNEIVPQELVRCQARRSEHPIPSVRLPKDDGTPGQRIGIWLLDLYQWTKEVGACPRSDGARRCAWQGLTRAICPQSDGAAGSR